MIPFLQMRLDNLALIINVLVNLWIQIFNNIDVAQAHKIFVGFQSLESSVLHRQTWQIPVFLNPVTQRGPQIRLMN